MSSRRRLGRGSIAAGVSTWLALAFHLLGRGETPAVAGIVIPFVLSWCACVVLAAWRGHALRLTASVVLSQGLFHLLFTLGATGAAAGGHHGSPARLGAVDVAGGASWSHMWLAHLAAAAITILALHSGERAIARLSRLVVDAARRLCEVPSLQPLVPIHAGTRVVPRVVVDPTGLGRFGRVIRRRGPPVSTRPR